MQLDREKTIKLVIVVLATLAALAVMSTMVQLIQTILPFLIVGAGIYAGYRWALSEAPAPTADEVEEQARGIFSRFRRGKKAVETTMKVGDALADLGDAVEPKQRARRSRSRAAEELEPAQPEQSAAPPPKSRRQTMRSLPRMSARRSNPLAAIPRARSNSKTAMSSSAATTLFCLISRAWKRRKKKRPKSPTTSWRRSRNAGAAWRPASRSVVAATSP